MEEERMKLDEELKRHREKARRVNIGQEVLEAKIKVPDISISVVFNFWQI
jgi:hypothetical protein